MQEFGSQLARTDADHLKLERRNPVGIHINDESICSMSKSYNLESLEKFTSDTTPDKELLATDKAIKFGSFQINTFWQSSIQLILSRSKNVKDDKFPRVAGMGPEIELLDRSTNLDI